MVTSKVERGISQATNTIIYNLTPKRDFHSDFRRFIRFEPKRSSIVFVESVSGRKDVMSQGFYGLSNRKPSKPNNFLKPFRKEGCDGKSVLMERFLDPNFFGQNIFKGSTSTNQSLTKTNP